MAEILVMKAINEENEQYASRVRAKIGKTLLINLLSSPGAGKTTLLERTLDHFHLKYSSACIEGDLFTDEDARRLERFGIPVIQLNTQGSCHLTANMILQALEKINLEGLDFLFVENIGNLVCPASFSLGEDKRVTLLSIAEGPDKIKKYPKAFQTADLLIFSKIDFLPLIDFSLKDLEDNFRQINRKGQIIKLSSKTGEGLGDWFSILQTWHQEKRKGANLN